MSPGSRSRGLWFARSAILLVFCLGATAEAWSAGGAIPGEDGVGLFYAVTHMHAAAYVLLFFVFLLSLANLLVQYGAGMFRRPISSIISIVRKPAHDIPPRQVLRGLKHSSLHGASESRRRKPLLPTRHRVEGSEAVGPVRYGAGRPSSAKPPTPLDGVNHPLPQFPSPAAGIAGSPRVGQGKPGSKAASEFKFSSAVDIPSREEIERREKTQLLVSGVVQGPDGKGMSSVIVYLTDAEGKRVGQSCRSATDTGEFRVLINEPGRYALKGYKRGFVMESSEPLQLPIESGKIEGYSFKMIPEGSVVSGRLLHAGTGEVLVGYEVRCACKAPECVQACHTNAMGQFRIQGAPVNSECCFEVLTGEGALLMRSAPFRTGEKKELSVEIRLPENGAFETDSEDAGATMSSAESPEVETDSSRAADPPGSQQPSSSL